MSELHNNFAEKVCKNENNMSDLWTFLTKSGIIDVSTEELLEALNMTKQQKHEQELLKWHLDNFYHIWTNEKGVYLTYIPAPDKPKGRKPISAGNEEKLNRKIIDFYLAREKEEKEAEKKAKENQEKPSTLRAIYPLWLDLKSYETTASGSIRRIDSDWVKFYRNDPIIDMDVRTLSKAFLKEWALKLIRNRNMTKTQYYNMSIIIRQGLDYAVDHDVITKNPFREFTVEGKLFRKVKKPSDETQVFLTTERPLIEAEAWADFEEKGCTSALAIPLAFQLGVRIGELVALKSTDIYPNGKYIHVQRMAQRQATQRPDGSWQYSKWEVVDHVKSSAGDRDVFLPKEARRIIKIILQTNEENGYYDQDYLFVDRGKRINPRVVDTRIRKYCDHINIIQKSTHKVRKTYISTLIDGGVNINEIRKEVGHEDEHTTYKSYCFNRQTQSDNEDGIERALAG